MKCISTEMTRNYCCLRFLHGLKYRGVGLRATFRFPLDKASLNLVVGRTLLNSIVGLNSERLSLHAPRQTLKNPWSELRMFSAQVPSQHYLSIRDFPRVELPLGLDPCGRNSPQRLYSLGKVPAVEYLLFNIIFLQFCVILSTERLYSFEHTAVENAGKMSNSSTPADNNNLCSFDQQKMNELNQA